MVAFQFVMDLIAYQDMFHFYGSCYRYHMKFFFFETIDPEFLKSQLEFWIFFQTDIVVFGIKQENRRISIQSYGMLVLGHWFLCHQLEVLWFIFLKAIVSKWVFGLWCKEAKSCGFIWFLMESIESRRLQHRCKRRRISYLTTPIFLRNWYACFTMSHYMYGSVIWKWWNVMKNHWMD